ncbi:ESPR-type extended signal peptide-containing protein [uncultured Acidaminococcus sp.]|uniref:ESPR-type extended signal peptide-containing protein n=1 Tax=uncultured Acidaminococcus sp. TaxID=352152 RepID=UPI0027DB6207|nr:ESPR-type extended signal peptide-containing protein [uncultured Acidaminococcus sp.]
MNRIFKVIFNRNRQLVQVVPEYAKNRGKEVSESRKGGVRGLAKVLLTFLATLMIASPGYAADETGSTGSGDTTYISDTNTEAQNIQALDKQVVKNAQDIAAGKTTTDTNKTDIAVNRADIEANKTSIASNKTAISKNTSDIATNTTNISENKTAIADNKTAIDKNASAISINTQNIATNTTSIANNTTAITSNKTSIAANASDITDLKNLANITDAGKTVIKKQAKLAVKVAAGDRITVTSNGSETGDGTITYTVTANNDGAISIGDTNLVSGGTLYTELRPASTGTYYYISSTNTTAQNLISLDATLNKALAALDIDMTDSSAYTSKLSKYFKVNPEETASADGKTKTYAPDAAANGTNSVAIGPNAKTAKYTTTTTSGDTTTTTETAADHAVAMGDGATVNAAGDKGIALGNGAVTGEAEVTAAEGTTTTTTDAKGGESSAAIGDGAKANGNQSVALGANAQVLNPTGTTVSTGSTAIGSGAKVDGGNDSIALGTSATVNTVSNAMALGSGATINKTAKESIAIGKGAVTGGVDKPIALTNGTTGILAAAGGVDSIAIGNGAVSEGNEALALGKGAKVTNGATGGDSAAAIVKTGSVAIGDGATVANSATSMAIGNGASITEGENTTVIGSSAKASQTKQALVAGYQASADSNASGSIALGDNASTHSEHTTAIGYKAEAHNADSIAIGSEAVTSDTGGGIAIGSNTSVAQGGIAVGKAANAHNISSLAIGNGAAANVNQSISIGYNAGVGTNEDEKEKNGSLVAIGTSAGNNVKGMQNVAIGASAGSAVQSSNNIAIGTNAGYGIKNVTSTTDTNPQNGYNISIGSGANYTEGNTNQNIVSSIAIGHATHAVNRAVAIGESASANGDSGMALGNSAASDGAGSIAIGNTASAADGNIALGAGSIAKGSPSGNARWTGQVAPTYYISVGNTGGGSSDSPLLRRISNVADGYDDHDVATIAQLQKVSDQLKSTITGTGSDDKDVKTYSTTYIDNEVTELKNDIAASKTKYFSVNPGSQTANSGGTAANGDGDVDAMAIGPNAKASNVKALAIGNNVSASGTLSIAIGTANNPSTDTTTADNPHPTSSEGISSVAVGTSAIAQSDNSIAIGTRATTYTSNTTGTPVTNVGVQSIAIGYGAETRAENAISFGTTAKANSTDSIAVGHNAQALNEKAIVIGSSTAYGSNSVTIGLGNTNNGAGVLTTGNSNEVTNSQGSTDVVKDSGIYGSSNKIHSVTTSNSGNAITDVSLVGNGNELNQNGEMNVLNDVSVLGNKNAIENGTAGAYTQTVKQIAVVGSDNTVKGNTQVDAATWGTVQRDTILGYGNTVDATNQWTPVSNLQILGNDVTATLGNSVYLGTKSSATASKSATAEAIQLAKDQGDTEALASDEYKNAATDEAKNAIKQKYEAKYIHAANIAAMDKDGISAGVTNYDTDYTYGNDSSYNYAGSQADGVVTVGSKDATRRIQNVSAGLVGPNSTDAVNGSQLYALTRQIRFGGDNSSFGTTTADDKNVVARGSNETLNIIGGEKDSTKLTDNNIGVVSDGKDTLTVKLSKNVNLGNDGSVAAGNTTLDTNGITITNGPKFTSSSIDADSQKITSVKAGEADTDAANVGQVKSARTLLTQGTNTQLADTEANGHHTYVVNVDNLAVKANGTGNTTVELANGINFVNGTNTTAAVGTDGTVTISATHNKLSTASAAPTGTKDDVTLTLTDADGNTVTSTGLKNTYTTVTKDGTAHTVTFARNDGITQTLSLGDLDGASKGELATTAAKATSEVTNGTNVTSVTKTTGNNGQNIYTVNVDDLAVKTTSGEKKSVHLADGLVFADGTNTTATVGDNGTIKFNVSEAAIKKQAVQAISVTGGSNVTVTPETNADGTLKTFTVAASDLKYSANGTNKTTSLANGISFASGTNTTAEIDNQGAIKINATHNKLDATGAATTATADSNAVTLTLEDADGNKTTTALTDTYTTISKDGANKKVTFKRNDGETQTIELSDLGGITAAQDKYITGGTVSYDTNGNGTAALTGTNGITASITGLKDTKVSSGTVNYVGTQGNASGSATLTMNDGSKVAITGLKDDYITSAAVGAETNHVTMTRLGGGTVDLNLNPILEKYSLSDYRLVGNGDSQDQAYQVNADGTVTLNVVDAKNVANKKTIQITGLASQSGVNAGRTTVKSSDSSVIVNDGTSNSDTHTYDIKVDYSKIPANLTVKYSGDNGTSGSNTMNQPTAFSGTDNQIVTTAENGKVSFKLADNISGIQSVTTGDAKLNTDGLTITGGPSVLKTGINAGGKIISNVADAAKDTDAATLGQVKNARTVVAGGSNVAGVTPAEGANNQMTYTVNVDNLSVKANNEAAKSVTLQNGLTFNDGTNTTASVGENGAVSYNLNQEISLTKVTAGSSTLDTSGLIITGGPKVTQNGIDAGSQKITGVANGENAADAVNKGQLDALQNQVTGGWKLAGKTSDGNDVTAQIGAGKTVTYTDGAYTKSVVTKDDSTGNATVKVDVTTGTFGSGAGDKAGTVTSTAKGLATTQDVANAINSAAINVVADNTPDNKTSVKAGDTIHFAKDGNLTLVQNGTTFTYGLNSEISISKVTTSDATNGSTVQDAKGITTTDAAGNTYIQNGQGITLTSSDKTKSPVKLTNTGLNNGGNKITGVGKGTDDADAVNVAQLKEVNDKVGSGWQIAGNDGQKVADIGAGKKVSFKTGSQYLTANTESAGTDAANVTYGLKTKALTAADGKVSAVDTAEDGLATAKNVAETINQTYWTAASGTSGSGSHTDETANPVDKQISAGDTVTFNAGNNLSLVQNGASFTYGLQANLTGMNTITFTPRNDADGHPISLVIGKQKDGVSNDEGYYITGLDNTSWNQSNYVKNRAATEAQLASAIQQVTLASQSGGFKLSDDNNNEVSQVLGQAIGVVGDSNITTTAETTTADPNGHIKVSLNKHIDLGTDGSLQAGGVTLKNNRVTVGNNGIVISSSDSERTVSNLSNTTWETAKVNQEASAGGYKGSTKAATESQLAEAISTATSTAAQNEQHIRNGEYSVQTINNGDGSKSQGVSIDIITGDGNKPGDVKGHVVIKDVAKASDVGDVSQLHDTLENPDGTRNVTGAINNLDNRVTGLDNRMDKIYTTAGQHSSVSAEDNIQVDSQSNNGSGGTDYKLSLNKEKIDLKNVTIEGNAGAVTAKTVTAEKYNVGDKTYISSDGLNANSQKITNVQAGTADTDAANVGQVREADEQLAGGIAQNARNISQLGREVDKLDSRIDRVGAGAAALAALHPGAYDPNDKVDFSAGYGNYRGASAAAVGMYYHPDERTILSMGVAMGGGENMVNAGVTWKLGRRTPAAPQPVPVKADPGAPALVPVSTAAAVPVRPVETAPAVRPVAVRTSVRPVETVAPVAPAARVRPVQPVPALQPAAAPARPADTNAQLMELLARQTAILEKLSEQKAVPAAAPAASGDELFTDVPENHWAYECALKMEKAGVLKGLGRLQVEGNPLLTRKDFARILYTALKNGATTNPALNSDNSLNRMASEFRGELKMVKG